MNPDILRLMEEMNKTYLVTPEELKVSLKLTKVFRKSKLSCRKVRPSSMRSYVPIRTACIN